MEYGVRGCGRMYESITVQTVHKLAKTRVLVDSFMLICGSLCGYLEVLCGSGVRGCGRLYKSITAPTVHQSSKTQAPVDKKIRDEQLGLVISASHQPRLAHYEPHATTGCLCIGYQDTSLQYK